MWTGMKRMRVKGVVMKQTELEKILRDYQTGPFRLEGGGIVLGSLGPDVCGYDFPMSWSMATMLNKAYQIGRWHERVEAEPPPATDDLYQPICKFCDQKVDEMVTVHFKSGDQRMCVECANDKRHRNSNSQYMYVGTDILQRHRYVAPPENWKSTSCQHQGCYRKFDDPIHIK